MSQVLCGLFAKEKPAAGRPQRAFGPEFVSEW